MKQFFVLALSFIAASPVFAKEYSFVVSPKDTSGGWVSKTMPLAGTGAPRVHVFTTHYTAITALPKGAVAEAVSDYMLKTGAERKAPFAVVSVPFYKQIKGVGYGVLTSFTIDIEEDATPANRAASFAKSTSLKTPLASGTWYKIAVPARGIYKIDAAFIQSLGVNTSGINTANIRLVGNGGAMISEDNKIPRPLDLTENALWVADGGDGKLDGSDFIAFYAPGPMRWDKDSVNRRFLHVNNLYADSAYYFVSFDAGPGLRIGDAPAAGAATTTVTSFNDYAAHEQDLYNPGGFGKEWWGEQFGLSKDALPARDFNFPLGGNTDSLRLRISAAARSNTGNSSMAVTLNGTGLDNYLFNQVEFADDKAPVSERITEKTILLNSNTASFHFAYSGPTDAAGYLNYIELNWRRNLSFSGGNFSFRDWRSVAPGAVAAYSVGSAGSSTQVWDVTAPLQPQRMSGSLAGSTYSFTQKADVLHEFVAFDGSTFATPVNMGKVDAQNLHGADAPQLVIVTHPDFVSAANRLADYHRQHDGLRVLVTTTGQVYNEFSSGGQDISGIRDMMRYYYLQAGTDTTRMPRYLLLFGDASFDYKSRLVSNSNYVPTYESPDGLDAANAFTVDDFYGFLDDRENMSDFSIINTLDIGIGRIPVASAAQAEAAVAKIISYTSAAALGPWRLTNTYLADNDDGAGYHLEDAEVIAANVDSTSPFSNDAKIYLESFPEVATPGGTRCPEMNKAIDDQIFKGTFLINYTGHGSTSTLAHERVLTADDFNSWKNANRLPFMVTATCDYARYDNPAYVSNGEQMILKASGGTIAMLTTTGPVYAGANSYINSDFLTAQYDRQGGVWPTFGDGIRNGKNLSFKNHPHNEVNFYRFTLLGDPALQPSFPKHIVHTDSIRDAGSGHAADSMRALGSYSLSGHISDEAGNMLRSFNGRAYITIYDKARTVSVTTRSPETTIHECRWKVRDNVIFKGITTVTNGHFSCAFIAPKDMSYDFGKARISYYAENGETDAAGMDTTVTSGGFYDGAGTDDDAPVVKPYIGDTLFRDGGITGANTLLYIALSDRSGINASGNGVGHDITAVLDGDVMHPYVLNDYYETEPNTYQRGHVAFPVSGLADGAHTFTVKAWDVYNNSGEGKVNFVVGNGKVLQVENLTNYPNPFRSSTHFFFEHNHPGEVLKVQIMVYDMQGRQVRRIEQSFTPGGSHSNEIIWDGTSDEGAQLGGGIYPYRMVLSTENGEEATAYQKLVIVR